MKKIFLFGLMVLTGLMGNMAHAQFGDYGVKAGIGLATVNDDLSTKGPILGASLGGYINYTFAQSQSALAEIFYLQSGINIIRRGNNFEEVFENQNRISYREGFMHAYYAQIPILACVHFELPIRQAGHVVGFYLGPAVSVGLFGRYADRKVSPGVDAYSENYDIDVRGTASDRAVFNHIGRLDVSAVAGLSYEYGPFTLSLYFDHGFIATSKGDDILRIIDNEQVQAYNSANRAAGTNANKIEPIEVKIPAGHNSAWMLSLSYRLGTVSR